MNFWPVDQPCTQLWYADDSSASGDIPSDHHSSLGLEIGLKYGYFPEPSKSHLIVTESLVECAKTMTPVSMSLPVIDFWAVLSEMINSHVLYY